MKNANDQVLARVRMFDDSLYQLAPEACEQPDSQGFTFGKLLPGLKSFADGQDPADVTGRLRELGKKGGRMDAADPLVTLVNPLDSNLDCTSNIAKPCNPDNDNKEMTVGFTFLGQFIDHDITLDKQKLSPGDPEKKNGRTPFFDLDSVYGQGPVKSPKLYDPTRKARLNIDLDAPRDLPRDANQVACIADGRNDEHVIISQLHLAFIKFHNQVVNYVQKAEPKLDAQKLFDKSQKLVRWHYQYIVVNQFLKATLDKAIYDDVKNHGPSKFKVSANPIMPREFQVAAYRFGHSQIRPGYKVNVLFGAPIFDAALDALDDQDPMTPQDQDPNDLRGGRRAPRRFVEWDTFFDFGTVEVAVDQNGAVVSRPKVKKNKRIDPFISSPMFDLPVGPGLPGPSDNLRSLAGRNLERHLQHGLPSGQDVAKALGYAPLAATHTAVLTDLKFHKSTPLWWYILQEALVQRKGRRLGQVGSRIVAEVFFGLLLSDVNSYWTVDPTWVPTLPRRDGRTTGSFTMTDLLTFARVA